MLKYKESTLSNAFLPTIFNINNTSEHLKVQQIIDENTDVMILDEIQSQLRELIKIRNPQRSLNDS